MFWWLTTRLRRPVRMYDRTTWFGNPRCIHYHSLCPLSMSSLFTPGRERTQSRVVFATMNSLPSASFLVFVWPSFVSSAPLLFPWKAGHEPPGLLSPEPRSRGVCRGAPAEGSASQGTGQVSV